MISQILKKSCDWIQNISVNDDTYNEIKNILLESEQWTADLKKLEEDIEHIALRLV